MNIKQLLEMPVGQRTGGFLLTVKTAKKSVEITGIGHKEPGRIWLQGAIFVDDTGEMIGQVCTASPQFGNHKPLTVGAIIRVIVGEIQTAYEAKGPSPEPNKKLFVEQYAEYIEQPTGGTAWGPETEEALAWQEVRREEVKGKCRTLLVCAYMQSQFNFCPFDKESVERANAIVEYMITGQVQNG